MAALCLAYHLTPAEYRALTVEEQRAMTQVLKDLNKAKG